LFYPQFTDDIFHFIHIRLMSRDRTHSIQWVS